MSLQQLVAKAKKISLEKDKPTVVRLEYIPRVKSLVKGHRQDYYLAYHLKHRARRLSQMRERYLRKRNEQIQKLSGLQQGYISEVSPLRTVQ